MDTALTRAAGLARLAEITPRTGRAYSTGRNTDAGPGAEPTTTRLSPYLRRRLILEQEAAAAAIAAHGPAESAKFVDEILWRAYFKGHLETRPQIWADYKRLVAQSHDGNGVADATAGRTGIDCFDHWARELVQTGWLHNHARMWFASIWIFTLGLPWALGADFFLRHLLDGDPASNTLSWRWVAGLHTRGKPYVARADNISRYTNGRFSPTGLNEDPIALDEPARAPARLPQAGHAPAGDVALLLHLDDLHPESLPLGRARVVILDSVIAHAPGAAARVRQADEIAIQDALARASAYFQCETAKADANLPVIAAWAPVGPSAEILPENCVRIRRDWDERTWPIAAKGYFDFRNKVSEAVLF